ncbi:MAG: toll/interleukin-1 receptor domain-containing protein [Methanophagales archaeon]|nr:toll/interleukin-1 receptor domain-containing protein [Methanophagales archaeon]
MSLEDSISKFNKKVREGLYNEAFDVFWSALGNLLRAEGRFKEYLDFIRCLFPNGEFIAPVLKERNIGWAHLILGMAYYENGFPEIALKHIGLARGRDWNLTECLSIEGAGMLIQGQCQILLGDLPKAEEILKTVAEKDIYASGHRITANLLLSHVALLSGNQSEARRRISISKEILQSNEKLSGFSKDVIWRETFLERCLGNYERAIHLATTLINYGNIISKFKGHLVLAAAYRSLNELSKAEYNLQKAKETLDRNDKSHRLANLLLERSKLEIKKQNHAEAERLAYKALEIGRRGRLLPITMEACILLAEAESFLEQWSSAANHLSCAEDLSNQHNNSLTFASLLKRLEVVKKKVNANIQSPEINLIENQRPIHFKKATNLNLRAWDVFISHASEDKREVADPLFKALTDRGLNVWYDTVSLKIGDRLLEKIDEGLAHSSFGVVILSKNFFQKKWTKLEIDGLVATEGKRGSKILPVWHGVSEDDVKNFSPILAGRVAGNTESGIEKLADRLYEVIRGSHEQDIGIAPFACIIFDEHWELVGGSVSLLGFVSEVRYNIKKGVKPICKIVCRGLSSARTQVSKLERSPERSPANRVRHVALLKWIDRYSKAENNLREGIKMILTHPALAKAGCLEEDSEMAQCLLSFIRLYQGEEIAPKDASTSFDLFRMRPPTLHTRVRLTEEETEYLKRVAGVDNIFYLTSPWELTAMDLPLEVMRTQAIPKIVYEVQGYCLKTGDKKLDELLDLSSWSCGLA